MKLSNQWPGFSFWQQWLFYSSLLFAAAGLAFAIFGNSFIFNQYNAMLDKIFWPGMVIPSQAAKFRAFIYGPLGGTIACCYILLAFIARYPFNEKKRWARNAIIIAFGVWVITDSAVCIYFKVFPQVYIINTISIIVKALPIIFTWKFFYGGE